MTYAAAGCLPDGDPCYFESREDACAFVVDEACAIGADDPAAIDERVGVTLERWDRLTHAEAADDLARMMPLLEAGRGAGVFPDPRRGSTYAWTIDEIDAVVPGPLEAERANVDAIAAQTNRSFVPSACAHGVPFGDACASCIEGD